MNIWTNSLLKYCALFYKRTAGSKMKYSIDHCRAFKYRQYWRLYVSKMFGGNGNQLLRLTPTTPERCPGDAMSWAEWGSAASRWSTTCLINGNTRRTWQVRVGIGKIEHFHCYSLQVHIRISKNERWQWISSCWRDRWAIVAY